MLDDVDIAVVGEIASVEPALIDDEFDGQGAVMVGLHPTEEWKADPNRSGNVVYFWFYRPKNLDIGLYREALPQGTEVALFGFDTASSTDTRFSEGDPNVTHYTPAPQGLFLPSRNQEIVNVWAENNNSGLWAGINTISELRKAATGK